MIDPTPTKLEVLHQQEERLVSILSSLKVDVLPKSKAMYTTMAEGYSDELVSIRKQIDLELETTKAEVAATASSES